MIEFVPARVLAAAVPVYSSLDPNNRKLIRSVPRDKTIEVTGEVEGPGPERNRTWYKTRDGFAYSAWLQKMEPYRTPKIYTDLGEWGIWIETIVANAPAYAKPDEPSPLDYIYNYGTVFHATEAHVDAQGRVWYNTVDEYASKDDNIAPDQSLGARRADAQDRRRRVEGHQSAHARQAHRNRSRPADW